MKAEDLRIGNIVLPPTGDPLPVDEIGRKMVIIDGRRFVFSMLKPVPLTEEWIPRLGLTDDGTRSFWIGNLHFSDDMNDEGTYSVNLFVSGIKGSAWSSKRLRQIKYVHELQNLVNALTGEELTVKK